MTPAIPHTVAGSPPRLVTAPPGTNAVRVRLISGFTERIVYRSRARAMPRLKGTGIAVLTRLAPVAEWPTRQRLTLYPSDERGGMHAFARFKEAAWQALHTPVAEDCAHGGDAAVERQRTTVL